MPTSFAQRLEPDRQAGVVQTYDQAAEPRRLQAVEQALAMGPPAASLHLRDEPFRPLGVAVVHGEFGGGQPDLAVARADLLFFPVGNVFGPFLLALLREAQNAVDPGLALGKRLGGSPEQTADGQKGRGVVAVAGRHVLFDHPLGPGQRLPLLRRQRQALRVRHIGQRSLDEGGQGIVAVLGLLAEVGEVGGGSGQETFLQIRPRPVGRRHLVRENQGVDRRDLLGGRGFQRRVELHGRLGMGQPRRRRLLAVPPGGFDGHRGGGPQFHLGLAAADRHLFQPIRSRSRPRLVQDPGEPLPGLGRRAVQPPHRAGDGEFLPAVRFPGRVAVRDPDGDFQRRLLEGFSPPIPFAKGEFDGRVGLGNELPSAGKLAQPHRQQQRFLRRRGCLQVPHRQEPGRLGHGLLEDPLQPAGQRRQPRVFLPVLHLHAADSQPVLLGPADLLQTLAAEGDELGQVLRVGRPAAAPRFHYVAVGKIDQRQPRLGSTPASRIRAGPWRRS